MEKGSAIFIDDENQVLRSLKRALNLHCKQWELFYYSSPQQALAEIQAIQPWVIVTDKRMPEMDGSEFLQACKNTSPDSIRVMLTGDTSHEAALASIQAAHILLPKPFEIEDILEVLERSSCLRQFTLSDEIRNEIGRIQGLPALPESYQRLITYLDSTEIPETVKIAELISDDSAMFSQIIKMANSSFFGFSTPIYSAEDAVVRLGQDLIKKIVLCIGLYASPQVKSEHGLLFAQAKVVAQKLVQLVELSNTAKVSLDRAYFTGLFHNIGALIEVKPSGSLSEDELGAFLLQLWGFESDLVNTVKYQSCPEENPEEGILAFQLSLAKELAQAEKPELTMQEAIVSLNPERLERAGLISFTRSEL